MKISDKTQFDASKYIICPCCGRQLFLGDFVSIYSDRYNDHLVCEECLSGALVDTIVLTETEAINYGIQLIDTQEKINELEKEIKKLEIDLLIKKADLNGLKYLMGQVDDPFD